MALQLVDRTLVGVSRSQIVTGREHVAGVEADADAPFVIDELSDLAKLVETAAETRALSGGSLEQRNHIVIGNRCVDPVERAGNAVDAGLRSRSHVRPWMQHNSAD